MLSLSSLAFGTCRYVAAASPKVAMQKPQISGEIIINSGKMPRALLEAKLSEIKSLYRRPILIIAEAYH